MPYQLYESGFSKEAESIGYHASCFYMQVYYIEVININFLLAIVKEKAMAPTPVLLPGKSHGQRSLVGCSPWVRWGLDTTERLHFHALEKEMATHSSVLAWRIPGTGEPGELPSMGSHRVGHD